LDAEFLRPGEGFLVLGGTMKETLPDSETLKAEVRRRYGSIAEGETSLNGDESSGSACCGGRDKETSPCGCSDNDEQARTLGYSSTDLAAVPDGANLGLGCGNPVALASLVPGQTVLDLGSGAGFDAFLAARAVGPTGKVIGVDMTPEMVTKARGNAKKGDYAHVEFRFGEIEALPVADSSVDVVISNCVINLCPDKRPVYREAFRALRPGGRIAVSDVVAREELSDDVKRDLALHSGCLAGATLDSELVQILEEAGFKDISIKPKGNSSQVIESWDSKHGFASKVFAAEVTATKPSGPCCGPTCCT
jgi:arsenite methyltransferase